MDMNIKITGLDTISKKIQEIQDKGHDTSPLMSEIANHLYNITSDSFEKQESPDGKAWSPIQYRKEDRSPDKILRDEGTMQDSLQADWDKDSAIIGLNATANGYPYPMVLQFGTYDGTVEARAFMPIDNDGNIYEGTVEEIEEIIEDYINEVLK